jgi:hypothetical protein
MAATRHDRSFHLTSNHPILKGEDMHIAHALGHSLRGGRRQFTVATLIVAFCITLALAIGGSATANAAGPDRLSPGENHLYNTWLIGETEVCGTNPYSVPGRLKVQPLSNLNVHDVIDVPPFGKNCIKRWWWASVIQVTNVSFTELGTWPVLTVETNV